MRELKMQEIRKMIGDEEYQRLRSLADYYKQKIHAGFMTVFYLVELDFYTEKGVFPLNERQLDAISESIKEAISDTTITKEVVKEIITESFGDINWNEEWEGYNDYSEWQWLHLKNDDIIRIIVTKNPRYKADLA